MKKSFIIGLGLLGLLFSNPVPNANASTFNQFFTGIKSIQYGTIAMSAGSGTATITAVNTSKAFLQGLGAQISGSGTNTNPQGSNIRLALTNSTTITATASLGDSTAGFVVVEYY